jgi:hypothetical protein
MSLSASEAGQPGELRRHPGQSQGCTVCAVDCATVELAGEEDLALTGRNAVRQPQHEKDCSIVVIVAMTGDKRTADHTVY